MPKCSENQTKGGGLRIIPLKTHDYSHKKNQLFCLLFFNLSYIKSGDWILMFGRLFWANMVFMLKSHFSKDYIQDIVRWYSVKNPQENINSRINNLLASGESFISRKNFLGHITASAIALDRSLSKIVLVYHKSLGKFIQPGGHVDETDKTFSHAAMRELAEETGFTNILAVPFDSMHPEVPLDIDIHTIPENQKKHEPEHQHFDFRYVFILLDNRQGNISEREIGDIVWKPINELQQITPDMACVAQKVRNLISACRDEIFFNCILNNFTKSGGVNIVMVAHLVPDILHFIQAIRSIAEKVCIIPKPNSISSGVLSHIPEELVYSFSRNQIRSEETLQKIFPHGMKSYVIDIGGYFADKTFFEFNLEEERVFGIVEDTENGLQKYEKLGDLVSLPLISVARSDLKQSEDDLVGYSVAYYTEMVLRRFRLIPRYLVAGIIGYGRLGKGIAKYFFNQNVKPFVYDINPIRMVEAYKDGCIPVEKGTLLAGSHLILCATGSQSITNGDFFRLRPGCYVASVTSSEDEFDLGGIKGKFDVTSENSLVKKFSSSNTHWYLINDGNAINFIDRNGDRAGDFIRLVQGEIILALGSLLTKKLSPGLQELSQNERKYIGQLFLDHYATFNR